MGKTVRIGISLVVAVVSVCALAAPSMAAPAAGTEVPPPVGTFSCITNLAQWPAPPMGGPTCTGKFYGAGPDAINGTSCRPCDFELVIEVSEDVCVAPGVSPTGYIKGDVKIRNIPAGTFYWNRLFFSGPFTLPGTALGWAHMVPEIPLGTCDAPASDYTITLVGIIF